MPGDQDQLTLAIILTAGGAVATSALISGIVQVFKVLFGTAWPGATASRVAAFILSLVFVVWAYVGTHVATDAEHLFVGLLAWYGIARLAMVVYDDASQRVNSLTGPVQPPKG